ncbi:MAG: translation initiation factor IF-3 [Verrucomicrobiales bacterium]|nr:translation initiation factor IF-3 [Verrucomicrobiales bacterium]
MRRKPREPRTRVNDRIRAPEIRVIYGEHNVVLPTHKALKKAKELGLDLVEIAPHARPPVCRIVDYGKYKYEQSKQKKADKPKKREKEVKFRVNIGPHDYGIKLMHAEDFLSAGFKVRIQLQFRGRQMAHKELGFELMKKVKEDLSTMGNCDLEPKLNNRNILMMLSPLPKEKQKRKFRPDDEDFDMEEVEAAHAEHEDEDPHDEDDVEITGDDSKEESEDTPADDSAEGSEEEKSS